MKELKVGWLHRPKITIFTVNKIIASFPYNTRDKEQSREHYWCYLDFLM